MTSEILPDLIGKPILGFLPALCEANPSISHLRLETYKPISGLWKRLKEHWPIVNSEIGQQAEIIAKDSLLPAWNHFAHLALKRGCTLEQSMVNAVIDQHSNPPSTVVDISRERVLEGALSKIVADFPAGLGVVVCSNILTTSGEALRIPMMDFLCKISESSQSAIAAFVRAGELTPAVIVNSGQSYHVYGMRLLTEKEWIQFLANSLLFAPITDARYIGHRLREMEFKLKVRSENGEVPHIVGIVSSDL